MIFSVELKIKLVTMYLLSSNVMIFLEGEFPY